MAQAPALLADRMLGKLARLLRMLGHDVEYIRPDEAGDPQVLARRAAEESRIVLTRSRRAKEASKATSTACLRVESNYPFHQAREVLERLGLGVDAELARCIEDNGSLDRVAAEAVAGRVPSAVLETAAEFRRCPRCERVYWPGTHFEGMRAIIASLAGAPPVVEHHQPPTSEVMTLEPLLDLHQGLETFFLQHRLALMRGDLDRAGFELRRYAAWMRRHVGDENELVLPVYAASPPPGGFERGGSPEVFRGDHDKILMHLDRIEAELDRLVRRELEGPELEVACLNLLDREKVFVDLCEHHDRREREYLYPELERLFDDEQKQSLLLQMVGRDWGLESDESPTDVLDVDMITLVETPRSLEELTSESH